MKANYYLIQIQLLKVITVNNKLLNDMIMYIEEHLTEKIEYKVLAKIVGVSEYSLQRIFVFITGISLSDYIKKRRLSKAFEDIRNTDEKVIDIALKYQYNSAPSFNRAFKKEFGISPTLCRKTKDNYKTYPIYYFEDSKKRNQFTYDVKKLDEINLYCYHIHSKQHDDFLFKIKELYIKLKKSNEYNKFKKYGIYGIFKKDNNEYHYYLGTKFINKKLEIYTIKKQKYICFTLLSNKQKDIVDFDRSINNQWSLSTNYKVNVKNKIEYYVDDRCYIYLPIE